MTIRLPQSLSQVAVISCLFMAILGGTANEASGQLKPPGEWRKYTFYEPKITQNMIYKGEDKPGRMPYGNCPSLEWFDGKFYAIWQGNFINQEGARNQKIWLSTSEDFTNWSDPVNFVGPGQASNPIDGPAPQKQPNLMNYRDKELWCVWQMHGSGEDNAGVYLSKLLDGEGQWTNRRIFYPQDIDGREVVTYTAQNPILLKSGRVLAGLTFIVKGIPRAGRQIRYNGFIYSDDEGQTWQRSNFITCPADTSSMWEPYAYEQADGRIRVFMRNLSRHTPEPLGALLTCTGTGAAKGEPLVFEEDAQVAWVESINSRMQGFPMSSGRYVMFYNDVFTRTRNYEARRNAALYFSRTGMNDYVAGPGLSRHDDIASYPQGIEHDGKIYAMYVLLDYIFKPRSMEGVMVDPAPAADKFYIWPRDRDVLEFEFMPRDPRGKYWKRTNPKYKYTRPSLTTNDGRSAILFKDRSTAGVETDPVDLAAGQSLTVRFDVKIDKLQEIGNLILCSFGDRIPIRIGMPSNRPGQLYAYGADQWQKVGPMPQKTWVSLELLFGPEHFSVKIGQREAKVFENPARRFSPRLYLGDGYEVDSCESNRDSEFLIDLQSFSTKRVVGES